MRRQAAGILVKIAGATPPAEVVNAIATIAADPTARPTMRCEMAQLIGQFKLTPAAKVDVRLVGKLARPSGGRDLQRGTRQSTAGEARSASYA